MMQEMYENMLRSQLGEMSLDAQEKIRKTLLSKEDIAISHWVRPFATKRNASKDEKPKVCGCLMMDGYLNDKAVEPIYNLQFVPRDESGYAHASSFWAVSAEDDWCFTLAEYYGMVSSTGDIAVGARVIEDTAQAFDTWAKQWDKSGEIRPYLKHDKQANLFLNAKGRAKVLSILNKLIKDGHHRTDFEDSYGY